MPASRLVFQQKNNPQFVLSASSSLQFHVCVTATEVAMTFISLHPLSSFPLGYVFLHSSAAATSDGTARMPLKFDSGVLGKGCCLRLLRTSGGLVPSSSSTAGPRRSHGRVAYSSWLNGLLVVWVYTCFKYPSRVKPENSIQLVHVCLCWFGSDMITGV